MSSLSRIISLLEVDVFAVLFVLLNCFGYGLSFYRVFYRTMLSNM